jgi:hypothetical protein
MATTKKLYKDYLHWAIPTWPTARVKASMEGKGCLAPATLLVRRGSLFSCPRDRGMFHRSSLRSEYLDQLCKVIVCLRLRCFS